VYLNTNLTIQLVTPMNILTIATKCSRKMPKMWMPGCLEVKVHFPLTSCSSDLRKAPSIIGLVLKGPRKWGFGMIFGVGVNTFGGKVHPSLELRVFRHIWFRCNAPYVHSVWV